MFKYINTSRYKRLRDFYLHKEKGTQYKTAKIQTVQFSQRLGEVGDFPKINIYIINIL